jgi:hypothetical protein
VNVRRLFIFTSIIFLISPLIIFSQEESTEIITITTYYPSPYGAYRDLEAKKSLATGNITASSIGSVGNLAQGELWVQDSIIFEPKSGDPSTWSTIDAKEGELVYSDEENTFYYYNGTGWVYAGKIEMETVDLPTCPVDWGASGTTWAYTSCFGTLQCICQMGTWCTSTCSCWGRSFRVNTQPPSYVECWYSYDDNACHARICVVR